MTSREIDAAAAPMLRARMHVPEIARRLCIPLRAAQAAYRRAWERARERRTGKKRAR